MDKFISPVAAPEGVTRELLTILAEECAEVAQRCTKALRFGTSEVQPGQPLTNMQRIEQEVGDIVCVFRHMENLGLVDWYNVLHYAAEKEPKLRKFLQCDQSKFPMIADLLPPCSQDTSAKEGAA